MPTYESVCEKCGDEKTYYSSIDRRHITPKCCGAKTKRVISAVRGFADLPEYVSPASGQLIRGRKQREDDFRRTNTRPWEGMESERKEAAKRLRESEQASDRKLTEAAHRAFAQLPPSKRKALESAA